MATMSGKNVCTANKSHDCQQGCLVILTFSCPYLDIWAKILCVSHFTLATWCTSFSVQRDCIRLEIGLCTKDCFEAKSPTLLHVELSMYFVSFLCNYCWETFPYTVHIFWAKIIWYFAFFTLVMWCTSFSVQRTRPWLYNLLVEGSNPADDICYFFVLSVVVSISTDFWLNVKCIRDCGACIPCIEVCLRPFIL